MISELGMRAHRIQKGTLMGELKEYADKETDLIVLSTVDHDNVKETVQTVKEHHKIWQEELKEKIIKGKLTMGWFTRVIATARAGNIWALLGWDANKRRSWAVILGKKI
jgi:hypothetical protein